MPKAVTVLILVVVFATLAAGCGCNARGCSGALIVRALADSMPTHAQLVVGGEVLDCKSGSATNAPCEIREVDGAIEFTFENQSPAKATVRILDESGALLLTEDVEPEYRDYEPNGEGCDPVCKLATVELSNG